jgi:mono/diheme cytochrome c family protein
MKLIAGTAMLIALGVASAWAAAADGKATFDAKCKMCHAADGKGTPGMVKAMGVKPIGGAAEADTKAAVTKGKNKMKPIAGVTGKALDDVAAYVASLSK